MHCHWSPKHQKRWMHEVLVHKERWRHKVVVHEVVVLKER